MTAKNPKHKCPYGMSFCAPDNLCAYCERKMFWRLIGQGAELLRVGALPNSYAVQDFLANPMVKRIRAAHMEADDG